VREKQDTGMHLDVQSLSEVEAELWESFPRAATVDLHTGDGSNDPVGGAEWGADRSVRAEVIAALLLGAQAADPGMVPAVRLSGARITGVLDLSFADVGCALLLQDCFWDERPRLAGMRLRQVNLSGSYLPGLQISDSQVDGLLLLNRCCFSDGVNLTGTRVNGILSLNHAQLHGDPALTAASLAVGRDLICTGMSAKGECRFPVAQIGGRVVLDGARLEHRGGRALTADGLTARRGVFCLGKFTAEGEVRFTDVQAGPRFTMAGAILRNPGGMALFAERLGVEGELLLDDGFTADGQVSLLGSTIEGGLSLSGATLRNQSGVALNAGRAKLDNGLYAMDGFTAHGEVQIGGARVRGSVNFSGASLLNPGGVALLADRLEVSGRFFCGEGFSAQGQISLEGARIGSSLLLDGARMSHAPGPAIRGEGLTVGAVLNCCDGFTADQEISLISAQVASELCFDSAIIHAGLDLRSARMSMLRTNSATSIEGTLDLRHAAAVVLRDHPPGWPGPVWLAGFTYTTVESRCPAADWLDWLSKDPGGYQPQPYEQLAAVYRTAGHDAQARTVLLTKQRQRRRTLPPPLRIWGYLQDWVVGYGYQPQKAALWLTVLLTIGTISFTASHPAPLVHGQAPQFSPFLYALDLLIPIVGFGQRNAFNPVGWHHWLAAALIAAGWILATTIAAGITRVLSRQ
jgi:hypothetical protein